MNRPTVCGMILLVTMTGCGTFRDGKKHSVPSKTAMAAMADSLENSLHAHVLEAWYPRNIDSVHGGYISELGPEWEPVPVARPKSLVQQSRHVWTTSLMAGLDREQQPFREYARHGYNFLTNDMLDPVMRGFFSHVSPEGIPTEEALLHKFAYGQAFAIFALSEYHMATGDPEALQLAADTFQWLDMHARDTMYGGYYEHLYRNGRPMLLTDHPGGLEMAPSVGLKEFNSSIHLLEAFTSLHRIWPDSLLKARLEEMFFLIRDTMVHADGYLQLYFYPDWQLVPDSVLSVRSGGEAFYSQHLSFGHDVETAYLLLEASRELGMKNDECTREVAKKLVDHSLRAGWDPEAGGFFYAGKLTATGTPQVTERQKAWWTQAEGLHALLLMHTLFPKDSADYYDKFLMTWEYIDNWLIDKQHGGWYNEGIDTRPGSAGRPKSHEWKTVYHNTRALVRSIRLLRHPEEWGGTNPL